MEILRMEGYESIYELDSFQMDFEGIFKKDKGNKKRYLSWLDRRLKLLDELGKSAAETAGFEWIEDSRHLCAIRYPHSEKNLRVIYVYADGSNVILLSAFLEKSKKDYKAAIKKCEQIIRKLKEMGAEI